MEKFPITIQKYDQYGSKTVEVFKFKIKNLDTGKYVIENGEEVMETMWDGLYHSYFELEKGNYEIENIEYPQHYFLLERRTRFTINQDTPFLDGRYLIDDQVKKDVGRIIISRKGKTYGENQKIQYKSLPNYSYQIYAEYDITDIHGKVLYTKDSLMDTITTDLEGKAYSKELPLGTYYIRELTDEKDYKRQAERHHISFPYDFSRREIIEQKEEIITDHKSLYIQIKSINKNLASPFVLKNIMFKLCQNKTNICIKNYSLNDLENKKEGIAVDYGEYYLGLFMSGELIKRFDHIFEYENDFLEAVIDFREYEYGKGEIPITPDKEKFLKPDTEILKLPKTSNQYLRMEMAILAQITFLIILIFSNKLIKIQYS